MIYVSRSRAVDKQKARMICPLVSSSIIDGAQKASFLPSGQTRFDVTQFSTTDDFFFLAAPHASR
jgi:hypothetical protein